MSNIKDDSPPDSEKSKFDRTRMEDDAAECDQARNMVLSVWFRLFAEEKALRKAKQSAEEKDDSKAFHIAQSKLDLVNELLSIDGLEELAHLLDKPEQPSDFAENTEPLKKVEQRLLFMKGAVNGLGYTPLEIPYGGKQKILQVCLKEPTLFTEATFKAAWKEARRNEVVKMADHEKFI